ncbi:MAG: hypothetical protein PIR02_15120 [Microbacterium enclense]
MTRRLALALAAAALTAVALTGCSAPAPVPTAAAATPSDGATPQASAPQESTEPEAAGDPTCETIIPQSTADDFLSLGWSVSAEPFRIGATEIDGGIQCKWGDQKITTDRVQMFGWAPIDEAGAAEAERDLLASGWRREDGPAGTYITENPAWAISKDSDGYGITYLFGDGWVKLADTRQSLLLVEGPS